jgi:MFS family permease
MSSACDRGDRGEAAETPNEESNWDSPGRGPHDAYASLRLASFRRYVGGNILATIASEMQTVAVAWDLYERTRNPLSLGAVGAVQVVPVVGLALFTGHAADRFPRMAIMQASIALQALCSILLCLGASVRAPIAISYLCLFVSGIALAFSFPARGAILPQLVPPALFANAVAWRTSFWQLAAVAGPALGGIALGFWKRPAPVFALCAFLAVVVIGLWFTVPTRPQIRIVEPMSWASLLSGVRFVRRQPVLLAAITLDLFAVLLGGATALLPIFAREILEVGPQGLGWLRAAPSVGALGMALALAHRPPLARAGQALLFAVVVFGVATIGFGLSRSFLLSLLFLIVIGASDNVSVVVRSTLVQTLTPDSMRGRVAAINSIFVAMSNELGSLESGIAAWLLGPVAAIVLGGLGCLGVVGAVARRWPEVGKLERLDELVPAEAS